MTSLPRIGARIRVAVIAPDLATCTSEGVVEAVSRDDTAGSLATLRLDESRTSTVRVTPGQGYHATWMELAPPLPAQPTMGGLVQVGSDVFRREPFGNGRDYAELTEEPVAYRTWEYVCSLGTPVPLVAAPDLSEQVELVRSALAEECEGAAEWCVPWHNTARALLAKHAGGGA